MSIFELASQMARPALFSFSPEKAHTLSIKALKSGMVPGATFSIDARLETKLGGLTFPNPVGLAAGYDKNAEVPDAILKLGFGFTEVGTSHAYLGNPEIPNPVSSVHAAALARLEVRHSKGGIVGVNIGANKTSEDFVADYEKGIETFFEVASYFTANISSPNTPGLRNLQAADALQTLLDRIFAQVNKCEQKSKNTEMDDIAEVVKKSHLDALIVSNTTLDRDDLKDKKQATEAGGLSGKPLFAKSTKVLANMRMRLGPDMPLIGVGGISNADDVIAKMEAGASLVQLYTGLIYGGPCLPTQIMQDLSAYMDKNEINHVSELVGSKTDDWLGG
ncbi:Dihydroorotate dehydrogenase (quinone) [Nymphon striatum]|nr:Dihydroorotate dehydrogenase (quinone) [Nymphon striatum]